MNELVIVRAVETIENTGVLDKTIDDANSVIDRVVPDSVRRLLHGAPLGHPAHPVAILIPAGAWISAAVLDFVPGQQRAARTLIGVGVLGAVPAAAAGIADWSLLKRKQQRVGIVHWAANVGAVALYSASYLQRRRGREASGKLLGMAGLALVSASGYLGGHLAYRQGANVILDDEPDFASVATVSGEWTTLGLFDSFQDGKLTPTELDGTRLVVYRSGLDVSVLAGTCSFCDDDLQLSVDTDESTVECPQDGSRFDIATGAVLRGPATSALPRFEAMVSTGMIEVRRG